MLVQSCDVRGWNGVGIGMIRACGGDSRRLIL